MKPVNIYELGIPRNQDFVIHNVDFIGLYFLDGHTLSLIISEQIDWDRGDRDNIAVTSSMGLTGIRSYPYQYEYQKELSLILNIRHIGPFSCKHNLF